METLFIEKFISSPGLLRFWLKQSLSASSSSSWTDNITLFDHLQIPPAQTHTRTWIIISSKSICMWVWQETTRRTRTRLQMSWIHVSEKKKSEKFRSNHGNNDSEKVHRQRMENNTQEKETSRKANAAKSFSVLFTVFINRDEAVRCENVRQCPTMALVAIEAL